MGFSTNKYVRGSIWWCNFDDVNANDTFVMIGKHPCVIVSCNDRNVRRITAMVVPLTSNTNGNHVENNVIMGSIDGKKEHSVVLSNQIRTVDCRDLYSYEGILPDSIIKEIEKSILWHLGLCDSDSYRENSIDICSETVNLEVEEVEIDETEVFEEPEERKIEIVWTGKVKREFLDDYDNLKLTDVIEKYGLPSMHSAQCRAYAYRKQLGLNPGRGKKKGKCKK